MNARIKVHGQKRNKKVKQEVDEEVRKYKVLLDLLAVASVVLKPLEVMLVLLAVVVATGIVLPPLETLEIMLDLLAVTAAAGIMLERVEALEVVLDLLAVAAAAGAMLECLEALEALLVIILLTDLVHTATCKMAVNTLV